MSVNKIDFESFCVARLTYIFQQLNVVTNHVELETNSYMTKVINVEDYQF